MKRVFFGIVGLGAHGHRIARALTASSTARLLAIASTDGARAASFAREYGAPLAFDSYDKLLKEPRLDAVFIASQNDRHAAEIIAAARAGKSILCEKPLALSKDEGRRITAAVEKSGVALGVGFHFRHHPLFEKARLLIAARAIGEIRALEMHWSHDYSGLPPLSAHMAWREDIRRSGGGVLMARGIHLLDLARFLTGEEISEVYARTSPPTGIDVTMTAIARVRNALATITASRGFSGADRVAIIGNQGRMELLDAFTVDGTGTLTLAGTTRKRIVFSKKHDVYAREIEAFSARLLGASSMGAALHDGLALIAIADAVKTSARTGTLARVRHFTA
jgi:1,5-anhydro-D-fructose reductase (1,5-anhydro-D-mannitol-forming)